jgi:multidrug resistance efflux pump
MKQKPPYYELDHETRRLVEAVCEAAQDLADAQYSVEARDGIQDLVTEVATRLGLIVTRDQPLAEVVPLRNFRVVKPTTEET